MERPLPQRLLAEFVGTFTLIFVAAGSIIAATAAGGGGGGAGLVTVALAYGLAIAAMVSALGHVSGAHFNPAVTIAVLVNARIKVTDAAAYLVAQLAGATVGAFLLRVALPEALWNNPNVSLGTPLVNGIISNGQAVLIEAVLTFFLVWVIFASAVDPEGAFGKIAGLAIGFAIVMGVLVGGPFTGGAMNPARAFGPALAGGFWTGHWVYWVGPIAGGIVAGVLYDSFVSTRREEEETEAWGAHGTPEGSGAEATIGEADEPGV